MLKTMTLRRVARLRAEGLVEDGVERVEDGFERVDRRVDR
jgi:hypothetical protein